MKLPGDPLDRVIGQEHAVALARVAARQHRHLLLVGPPGTGKSMVAQAIAYSLPPVNHEIQVVHDPYNPERPFIEVATRERLERERQADQANVGKVIDPEEAPPQVAQQLGYLCANCRVYSPPDQATCPNCSVVKTSGGRTGNPLTDLYGLIQVLNQGEAGRSSVRTTRSRPDGSQEVTYFERAGEKIRLLDEKVRKRQQQQEKQRPRKRLVPMERNPFVMATGASETELLGDVRHDPYGGHGKLGTPPYQRVIPGSIHEAHQGVLFIDELPQLGHLQHQILTAMQEKVFPIAGRNPQSAGAAVRVDDVPCDFIFVGACNTSHLPELLAPLRSRIIGSGYEVLMATTMIDTPENRASIWQFFAQEVVADGRIPHGDRGAVEALIELAARRAKDMDRGSDRLTLRLRELGGVIRVAGDIAVMNGESLIKASHIQRAVTTARSIEEQLKEAYGSYNRGLVQDKTTAQLEAANYNYWNRHLDDDAVGYE